MYKYLIYSLLALFITGCSQTKQATPSIKPFISDETQLQTRQYQVKEYKTDKERLMKVTISTLQDDNYIIHHSDTKLGIISASKKEGKQESKLSINAQEVAKNRSKLRINIEMTRDKETKTHKVDRVYYYYIFDRVAKSLFLEDSLAPKKIVKKKRTIIIKKPKPIVRHHTIKSIVPKNMVVTRPPKLVTPPKIVAKPKVEAKPKVVNKDDKRVVTRDNRGEILRQSTHVYQEVSPQEVYYDVAPNPNAATQYYYNPQTDQYEYIEGGY
jgi:hypothetical protein